MVPWVSSWPHREIISWYHEFPHGLMVDISLWPWVKYFHHMVSRGPHGRCRMFMASGQPSDHVQTMRTQHIVPQQTNLNLHGYGPFNPDRTNLVQQQQLYSVQINSTQQQQDASRQQNVQGYHNSALLMRPSIQDTVRMYTPAMTRHTQSTVRMIRSTRQNKVIPWRGRRQKSWRIN